MKTVSPEIIRRRERWLEALESDRFLQGDEMLMYVTTDYYYDTASAYPSDITDVEKFCCMGVACKTLRIRPKSWSDGFPPKSFNELVVGTSYKGSSDDDPFNNMLAGWNDRMGMNFKDIAKRLRLKSLFGPNLDLVPSAAFIAKENRRISLLSS